MLHPLLQHSRLLCHNLALRLCTTTCLHKCPYQALLKLCQYLSQLQSLVWSFPAKESHVIITPQDPRRRSDSPVPAQGPPTKPLTTTGSPCTLTTIDEQPIKMHIKKRASDTLNNQWEIKEIPAKSRNITRSRRHLLPPPKLDCQN